MAELFLMAAATTVEHLLSPGVLGVLRRGRGGGDGGTRFGVEPASAPCDIDAAHCTADGHYDAVPPSPACGAPPITMCLPGCQLASKYNLRGWGTAVTSKAGCGHAAPWLLSVRPPCRSAAPAAADGGGA
jgi:hypothetical protein